MVDQGRDDFEESIFKISQMSWGLRYLFVFIFWEASVICVAVGMVSGSVGEILN